MPDRSPDGTAYRMQGPPGAPVVALVHGLGLTGRTWDAHLPALSTRFRVVTYDLCGHGDSPLPRPALSLLKFSEQLLGLFDHLGVGRSAVVGFSLGGMINRRFAIDHPERVTALGILNSPHERDPAEQARVEARAADTSAGGPAATIDAAIARWFTASFRTTRPDVIDAVRRTVLANDPVAYAAARLVLARGVTELIRPDPPIIAPTLVMTCENDSGSTPDMSRAIASEIAGAELVVVPGLQHMGLIEQPELFTGPLMRFLDSVLDPV